MKRLFVGLTALAVTFAGAGLAQDAPFAREIKARQGIMVYRSMQAATLGGMAKGEIAYDAAAAQTAADNLLASATINTSQLWPEGSDNASNPASDVAAGLWDPASDIGGKAQGLVTAATAMQAAAGQGLEALQAAMGPVGEACGACHKVSRVPD